MRKSTQERYGGERFGFVVMSEVVLCGDETWLVQCLSGFRFPQNGSGMILLDVPK